MKIISVISMIIISIIVGTLIVSVSSSIERVQQVQYVKKG